MVVKRPTTAIQTDGYEQASGSHPKHTHQARADNTKAQAASTNREQTVTADHRSSEPKRCSEMTAPIGEHVQNVEAPAPAHAIFFLARRGRRWRQRLVAGQSRLPRHVQHARRMHKARWDRGWPDNPFRGGSRITLKRNRCLQGARASQSSDRFERPITTCYMDRQCLDLLHGQTTPVCLSSCLAVFRCCTATHLQILWRDGCTYPTPDNLLRHRCPGI